MKFLGITTILMSLTLSWANTTTKEKSVNSTNAVIEVVMAMSKSMQEGNLESVLKYYEPDASLVAQPGVTVSGTKLREAMQGYVSMKPKFDMPKHEVIVSGDTALHSAPWTMEGIDPSTGKKVQQEGFSVAVLRLQKDGRWLLVIDNPFGDYVKSK